MSIHEQVEDLVRNQKTSLPTLPVVINNIIATAQSSKTSAKDLASFVINDPSISARVLKIANSAYYGLSREIDTVSRAIVVIGFKEVLALVLGMGVFSSLSEKGEDAGMDMSEFWKHSIGVGFGSKKLAKKLGLASDESTVLLGLLHDIGKLIFAVYFPEEYEPVLKEASNGKVPLHRVEKDLLGLDHCEMGAILMEHWNFPRDLVGPIQYHHSGSECPPSQARMSSIVGAADFMCHKAGIGYSGNKRLEKTSQILSGLELPEQTVMMLAQELASERSHVEAFLQALS